MHLTNQPNSFISLSSLTLNFPHSTLWLPVTPLDPVNGTEGGEYSCSVVEGMLASSGCKNPALQIMMS